MCNHAKRPDNAAIMAMASDAIEAVVNAADEGRIGDAQAVIAMVRAKLQGIAAAHP